MTITKHLLDSFNYNVFYPLARQLPLSWSYKLATAKGTLDAMTQAERIERISSAMHQVFADQISRDSARRLAKYHIGMLAREEMDVYWLEKMRPNSIDRFISLKGLDNYVSAKATGKPIILYTAHFGRLIMPAIALGLKGYETSALMVKVDENTAASHAEYRYRTNKIEQMQNIMKGDFVNSADSMRALYRVLQRGNTLIVLIDVAPVPGQPFYEAPFLLGAARFPKGIVKLALKTGALLVPYFTYEHEGRLTGEFLPALSSAVQSEVALLRHILEPVEEKIFEHPEQWWMWPWLNAFWTKR